MSDLITTLHPINDDTTDLYPNVKNENIPPVVSGKDAMEALEGDFSTLKTDEIQVGGVNGTLINKDQIVTQNKVINLDEIVDDAELAQGLNGKVDKVSGKGLSTNDYTNADKALVDTIPDKVNKEQGKGLSTNDFTNEYKKDLDQDIPEQIQLFKDAFEETGIAINGKVDKVQGKGLSANDFTNADKALVDSIPNKVDKVAGKGLSANDFTNADKAYLDNLPNYFISLAKGGVANVADADMPSNSNTPYFGAKHGTTSHFTLAEGASSIKVTSPQYSTWASIAVNGAGGVNLVSNRDGVSSANLSAGNFKVIADHLDNGNHYKHIFEINADNGITFTRETPNGTHNVGLPMDTLTLSEYESTLVTKTSYFYAATDNEAPDLVITFEHNDDPSTKPTVYADCIYFVQGSMLYLKLSVANTDSTHDITVNDRLIIPLPVAILEHITTYIDNLVGTYPFCPLDDGGSPYGTVSILNVELVENTGLAISFDMHLDPDCKVLTTIPIVLEF